MNIDLSHCPLCNSGQFNLYIESKDYSVSREKFSIASCQQCSLKFTNPRPVEEDLGSYYESEDYISHTNESNNLLNSLYKVARVYTIQQKSDLLAKWSPKGRLLDIGCGTGEFLSFNNKRGWEISGVEVSDKARKQAEEKINHRLYTSLSEVPEEKKYHAVTLWHVLEHVSDLQSTCKKITKLLAPNGTLVVAVPNYQSFDATYYREFWAAYDVPRHLYHFSRESMQELWKMHGMEVKAVLPMKLDAFYVSMLSEKYKTGRQNLVKAAWVGLKSNVKAKNSSNYSSLIYIIRKQNEQK